MEGSGGVYCTHGFIPQSLQESLPCRRFRTGLPKQGLGGTPTLNQLFESRGFDSTAINTSYPNRAAVDLLALFCELRDGLDKYMLPEEPASSFRLEDVW